MSESEQNTFMDSCFSYDKELKRNGHCLNGQALQGAINAAMLRMQNCRVSLTVCPFA
jgi:hypothetical protein